MPTASQSVLVEFFQNDLPFTPTAGQVDQFERDLALVSPNLMKAALKEAAAGKALQGIPFNEKRAAIFQVYYRKVAEHAQLFPVFHAFETAFRSTVTVELETHYGIARWWVPIVAALRAGNPAKSVTFINGRAITKDTAHQIGQIILAIEGDSLGRNNLAPVTNGYDFTELCDLSHISGLIYNHWQIFGPRYFAVGARPMLKTEFNAKFRHVREARNDVYHHKSVANMTHVVKNAEELLDRLNCSLEFACDKTRGAKPLNFTIPPTTQHNIWN